MFTKNEKIILKSLPSTFKWIARDVDGTLCVYEDEPEIYGIEFTCRDSNPPTKFAGMEVFEHIFKGVTFENSPIKFKGEVLDKVERLYLKAVFGPFRKRIIYVTKRNQGGKLQYIFAKLEDNEWISFPRFEPETMYKGMKVGKKYSLTELGIKMADIAGHCLEFIDDCHTYIVDGIIVPSVSQVLSVKFGKKYKHVNRQVLQRAAEKGTAVHAAIENYCKTGEESDFPELRNFKFLKKKYGFSVIGNEINVIISRGDVPVCAGRLDLVLQMDGKTGLADIKRTSTLDKEHLAYQLNLYRLGYQQCYGINVEFLRGVHLRDDVRKFVDIPINEDLAWSAIKEYEELNKC